MSINTGSLLCVLVDACYFLPCALLPFPASSAKVPLALHMKINLAALSWFVVHSVPTVAKHWKLGQEYTVSWFWQFVTYRFQNSAGFRYNKTYYNDISSGSKSTVFQASYREHLQSFHQFIPICIAPTLCFSPPLDSQPALWSLTNRPLLSRFSSIEALRMCSRIENNSISYKIWPKVN